MFATESGRHQRAASAILSRMDLQQTDDRLSPRVVDVDQVAAATAEVRMLTALLRGALARLRLARGGA